MPVIKVQRHNDATKLYDTIYMPTPTRPTNQPRLARAMATAMATIPLVINGQTFLYSDVVQALDDHASEAWTLVEAAAAHQNEILHHGPANNNNNNNNNTHATGP
jgi:hypothetical protein